MKAELLIQWMRDPARMDRESLPVLKALLDDFPSFGLARMLYLKALDNVKDHRFSKALILTSLSVPDRRRLFYFIEGKSLPEQRYDANEQLASDGFSLIDRFLVKRAAVEGASDLDYPMEEFSEGDVGLVAVPEQSVDPITEPESKPEMLGRPIDLLSFGEETYAFDYLNVVGLEPVAPEAASPMRGQDIIDAFLAGDAASGLNPIRRMSVDEHPVLNAPEPSVEEDLLSRPLPEDTFTETLAKIYLKQKRYDRALEIFKSLNLKYPEKSVYFADQIRFLEKLILNIPK